MFFFLVEITVFNEYECYQVVTECVYIANILMMMHG